MPGAADPEASPPRGRSLAPLAFAALLGFGAGDALKPPPDQALAHLAVGTIDAYRSTLSPAIAKTGLAHCLYTPTCSAYGREAISRYGLPRGGWMAAGRILRCNPWSKGGVDPVP
jgi:putative membrane protein insertion efficiency factor